MTSSSEPDPGSKRRYSAWPHHRVTKPTATEWSARTRRIALILVWFHVLLCLACTSLVVTIAVVDGASWGPVPVSQALVAAAAAGNALVWWRGFVVNERLKPEAALDGPT